MLCRIHLLHSTKRIGGFRGFCDASFIYKSGKKEVNFISYFCVKFGEFFAKIATCQQRNVCTSPMFLEIVKIHPLVFADRRLFCFGKCQQGIKVTVPIFVCDSIFHIHILSFSYFMVASAKRINGGARERCLCRIIFTPRHHPSLYHRVVCFRRTSVQYILCRSAHLHSHPAYSEHNAPCCRRIQKIRTHLLWRISSDFSILV